MFTKVFLCSPVFTKKRVHTNVFVNTLSGQAAAFFQQLFVWTSRGFLLQGQGTTDDAEAVDLSAAGAVHRVAGPRGERYRLDIRGLHRRCAGGCRRRGRNGTPLLLRVFKLCSFYTDILSTCAIYPPKTVCPSPQTTFPIEFQCCAGPCAVCGLHCYFFF